MTNISNLSMNEPSLDQSTQLPQAKNLPKQVDVEADHHSGDEHTRAAEHGVNWIVKDGFTTHCSRLVF